MLKSKMNVIVITFIILFIFFTALNYVYAKNNDVEENWIITITNDTKEINDTHEIKFEVEKTKDLVPGKIAPGMKAIAEIEINLEKIKDFVDIEVKIDDSKLSKVFSLNIKLNEKSISMQELTKIKSGSVEKIILELIWEGNNIEDTNIGANMETIEIPIQIRVLQHI